MSKFKDKITCAEVAEGLLPFLDIPDPETDPLLKQVQPENKQKVWNELVWLDAFAVDVAVFSVFGRSPERTKILDTFDEILEDRLTDKDLYQTYLSRMREYEWAFTQAANNEERIHQVAMAFTKFCEQESIVTAFWGATLFSGAVKTLTELLSSWREQYEII